MTSYERLFSASLAWMLANTTSVLTAIIVICAGWYGAGFLSRRVAGLLRRSKRMDTTITPVIADLARYSVLAITAVIVLGEFGVQTASILAVLGAIGLAIALALQGTLSNIAAGVMLIWLRPFNAGEYIDAEGTAGTVLEIGLFGTKLRTYDGVFVFAPNSKLWNAKVVNYSREKTRMVEIKIGIGYSSSIADARKVLLDLAADKRILANPAPSVFVGDLGSSAVQMVLRVWVKGSDWWGVKIDFTERGKLGLDAAGVEIPFNKLDVQLTDKRADAA